MRAAELARRLSFKRAGNQWLGRCVVHPDRNPSMIIFEGRNGAAQVRCLSGCSSIDIVNELKQRGVWDGSQEFEQRPDTPRTDPNRHKMLALQIWQQAVDPRGTFVEEYLGWRGLVLPKPFAGTLVRYHPRCPTSSDVAPALIVLMRDLNDWEPCAIQRLFLAQDVGGKVWKSSAKMLGPAGNACMSFAGPDETYEQLSVCEGFETGLSLHTHGRGPVWALGSAGAIARFPVLADIATDLLTIYADHDEPNPKTGRPPGLEAALACKDRWRNQHQRNVSIIMPTNRGDDFASLGAKHGG